MPADSAYGIFELGMNHPGEIAPLSRLVEPHVAIVTTVEAVHTENFPSAEAAADAKAEIFAGLGPAGVATLNRATPHFAPPAAPPRRPDGRTSGQRRPSPSPPPSPPSPYK